VAEERLDRAHRLAGRGKARRERMHQVAEPDGAHAGVRARALEASAKLRPVERLTGLRVREDEVVVGAKTRSSSAP
jgi:hypothetical protein